MENEKFDEVAGIFPNRIANILKFIPESVKKDAYEIRLRADRPLIIFGRNSSGFIYDDSTVSAMVKNGVVVASEEEIRECIEKVCSYSVYAHQNEMAEGFITFGSGIRVGFCGTAVISEGKIKSLRNIDSLNIRIPGEYPECAVPLLDKLYSSGGFNGLIVAGAPCSGKTTLLKSVAYQLSSEYKYGYLKTAVIDERFELGSAVGINCDILRCYPKNTGIIHAVRVLSPQIVICDELSDDMEADNVIRCLNSGIKFAVSVHCGSKKDLINRPLTRKLINSDCFDYVVLLDNSGSPGRIQNIYRMEDLKNEVDFDSVRSSKLLFSGIPDYI